MSIETKCILNFNEGDGQLAVIDEANRHSQTPSYTDHTLITSNKKFGNGSLNVDFDSQSSKFILNDVNIDDFNIFSDLTSTHTLDFWFYPSTTFLNRSTGVSDFGPSYRNINNDLAHGWALILHRAKLGMFFDDNTQSSVPMVSSVISTQEWHHIILFKKENKFAIYLNGNQKQYGTIPFIVNYSNGYFGIRFFRNGIYARVNYDSIRLMKGNHLDLNPNSSKTDKYIVPTTEPEFINIQYELITTNTNGSINKDLNKSYYDINESVVLTATPDEGYTFTEWSGDATGSTNPLTVTMDADKNIIANFILAGKTKKFNKYKSKQDFYKHELNISELKKVQLFDIFNFKNK